MNRPSPRERALRWLALAALAVAAFGVRLWVASRTSDPAGTDGYYYVVQVETLVETGRLHVPDGSWVLRLLAVPHLLGVDPVWSVRIVGAWLAAACVPAAWAVGVTMARGTGPSWALAGWAAASPTLTHLSIEFPKNLGAIPTLLCAFAAARTARGRGGWALALGFCLLAATAHRVGAAVVLLSVLGGLVTRLRPSRRAGVFGLVGATVFVGLAATTPGLLHLADLERLQLRATPWPPPPWSWLPGRRTDPVQLVELVAPWVAVCAGIAGLRDPARRPAIGALLVPLVVCLFPFWRADTLDLGYRLSLTAPALAFPLLVLVWPARWPVPGALVALALPAATFGFDPASTPPYDRYRALIAAIPRPLPDLLILHVGASFLYDHETGHEAMAWAPEPELDRTRVGRVVWGIRDGEWTAWAPVVPGGRPLRLDRDYVYVREDVWEAFVTRARLAGDDDLAARIDDPRNPLRVRPRYLLRNR